MNGHVVDPGALQRLLEDSGVAFKQNRRSYIFTCPRCSKPGKLNMFKADGRFVCWVCAETSNFRGRPEFALVELLGLSMKEVRARIYGDQYLEEVQPDFFRLCLRDFWAEEDTPADLQQQVRGLTWPLDFYPVDHPHARRGLEYLQGRGISLELAQAYGLRYCPIQKRVIFPVTIGEKLVGWQARAIFDTDWEDEEGNSRSAPKILTTGKRDSVLMFQDRLVGSDHAIICEGPVDALKCHLAGGNVATMGKVVSPEQIQLIKGSGVRKVYLAQDRDAATETMKLTQVFDDYLDETGARYELYRLLPAPGYEDLGDMSPEQVLQQFLVAPRVIPGQLFLGLGA
jgi:hypothetical protein